MKKKINNLVEKIPSLIIPFLYLQPLLDIVASLLINENINANITAFIRLIFMGIITLYLFLHKYENKKKYITYILLLITTILIHTGIIFYRDPSLIFYEFKTSITTYYFIFTLLSFMVIYKEKSINKNHLRNIFVIYIILTFIPNILHIGFDSYWHSKVGSAGWFYSANGLGAILVLLIPLFIERLKSIKVPYLIIFSLITIYVFFSIGTKTPVLGLAIIIFFNLLYFIYKMIKEKRKKSLTITFTSIIIALIIGIILIPKTSFYKNLGIHYNYLKQKEVSILSKDFLNEFVFSERLTFETKVRKYYKESNIMEKVFGMGYIHEEESKFVEIDYFDIIYKEGIVGFILYFIPVIYIIYEFIRYAKKDYANYNLFISILLVILLALFQGHIFISPAISIYVALIFALAHKEREVSK